MNKNSKVKEEEYTQGWAGYWNPKKRSFGKAIIDFMRDYYFKWIIISIVGDVKNKTVLEAGCGTSESLVLLSKHAKKVYGVDLSKDAIKISETHFKEKRIRPEKYELKLGDINNIPYPDNMFDIVFNAGVIEHFTDLKPIKEMIRITKPEGRVVILVPASGLYQFIFKLLEKLASKDEFCWEEHKFYNKKMMEQELRDSGAQKIEVFNSFLSLGVYVVGRVRK